MIFINNDRLTECHSRTVTRQYHPARAIHFPATAALVRVRPFRPLCPSAFDSTPVCGQGQSGKLHGNKLSSKPETRKRRRAERKGKEALCEAASPDGQMTKPKTRSKNCFFRSNKNPAVDQFFLFFVEEVDIKQSRIASGIDWFHSIPT